MSRLMHSPPISSGSNSQHVSYFTITFHFQCQNIQDRNNTVELWSGAAQYCLLVGNYNSATAILESLDMPPIARLQITVKYCFKN